MKEEKREKKCSFGQYSQKYIYFIVSNLAKADQHASKKQHPQNSKANILSLAQPFTVRYYSPFHTV